MQINVARWMTKSAANGPGERFVLWVQGCSIHCRGCWNLDTWSPQPRHIKSIEEIWAAICEVENLEGITFTGGEPFDQAGPLATLAELAREKKLSILIFSGYTIDQLTSADQRRLLAVTDVLVAGPYVESLRLPKLPLLGSSNQQIHFLTNRYSESDLAEIPMAEAMIKPDGSIVFTGFPDQSLLSES